MPSNKNPIEVQEEYYRLPYHWFPKHRYNLFANEEKKRIIFNQIQKHGSSQIMTYLDAGCGDGKWTADIRNFLNNNANVYGIDFSDRAIGFAELITPEIQFSVGSILDVSFPDEMFDLITCIEVLEHLPDDDQIPALRELRRLLKPDGLLIVTVPSVRLKMPPHHFRHYTLEHLRHLLNFCGFSVVSEKGQSIPYYGYKRKLRSYAGKFPFLWKLWNFTYREVPPSKATNLIIGCKPISI